MIMHGDQAVYQTVTLTFVSTVFANCHEHYHLVITNCSFLSGCLSSSTSVFRFLANRYRRVTSVWLDLFNCLVTSSLSTIYWLCWPVPSVHHWLLVSGSFVLRQFVISWLFVSPSCLWSACALCVTWQSLRPSSNHHLSWRFITGD